MRKILIITSSHTGHGHKSITEALMEQFEGREGLRVEVVEGFSLFGRLGVRASKLYGPMTRYSGDFWKITWALSKSSPKMAREFLVPLMHDRFLQYIKENTPDLILSVHPVFNGTILDCLEEHGIQIPFVTLLADLVDIHPLWVDRRALHILCPTEESLEVCAQMGVPRESLVRCGFPTRAQFVRAAQSAKRVGYDGKRPLRCLLMSGGEGSGNLLRIAKTLLRNFRCEVTILCGRNKRLLHSLQRGLEEYGDAVRLLGFQKEVERYMLEADVAFLRGSPNTLMEAVVCNVPIVITGALPGQEARNPEYMAKYGLAAVCTSAEAVQPELDALLADNAEGLKQIARKQRAFRNFDNAKAIADRLDSWTLETEKRIPEYELKFPTLAQMVEVLHTLENRLRMRRRRVVVRQKRLRAFRRKRREKE